MRLTEKQKNKIAILSKEGKTGKELAKRFHCSEATVYQYTNRKVATDNAKVYVPKSKKKKTVITFEERVIEQAANILVDRICCSM